MVGGAGLIVSLTVITTIYEFVQLDNDPFINKMLVLPTVLVCVITLITAVIFLLDGFRRMVKVLNQDECINRRFIIVISFAYLVEALQFVALLSLKKPSFHTVISWSYVIDILFAIGNSTLATVVFRLGVD